MQFYTETKHFKGNCTTKDDLEDMIKEEIIPEADALKRGNANQSRYFNVGRATFFRHVCTGLCSGQYHTGLRSD